MTSDADPCGHTDDQIAEMDPHAFLFHTLRTDQEHAAQSARYLADAIAVRGTDPQAVIETLQESGYYLVPDAVGDPVWVAHDERVRLWQADALREAARMLRDGQVDHLTPAEFIEDIADKVTEDGWD